MTLGGLPLFKGFTGYSEDKEEFVEDAVGWKGASTLDKRCASRNRIV
jgi:hypothetical protein